MEKTNLTIGLVELNTRLKKLVLVCFVKVGFFESSYSKRFYLSWSPLSSFFFFFFFFFFFVSYTFCQSNYILHCLFCRQFPLICNHLCLLYVIHFRKTYQLLSIAYRFPAILCPVSIQVIRYKVDHSLFHLLSNSVQDRL